MEGLYYRHREGISPSQNVDTWRLLHDCGTTKELYDGCDLATDV